MRAIPGVESAAVGLSLPYERGLNNGFRIDDGPNAGSKRNSSSAWVTLEYFKALQIPVRFGRAFTDSDSPVAEKVAVVNTSFGRKFFGNANPVDQHIDGARIVGVVADVAKRPGMVSDAPISTEPMYYLPAAQTPQDLLSMASVWFQPSWIVRTRVPLSGIAVEMQHALASVDSGLPFSGFYSMKEIQAEQLQLQRIEVALLSSLGALALLLSGIGVYSLVANLVVERTREIGIRLALGSTVADVMMTVGRTGVLAGTAGIAAGLTCSPFILKLLRSQIYGVTPTDPPTLIAVSLGLLLLCVIASVLPVLRISRIDAADVLRLD